MLNPRDFEPRLDPQKLQNQLQLLAQQRDLPNKGFVAVPNKSGWCYKGWNTIRSVLRPTWQPEEPQQTRLVFGRDLNSNEIESQLVALPS